MNATMNATPDRILDMFEQIRDARAAGNRDRLAYLHRECLADFIIADRAAAVGTRGASGQEAMSWASLLALIENVDPIDDWYSELVKITTQHPAVGIKSWEHAGFGRAAAIDLYLIGGPHVA